MYCSFLSDPLVQHSSHEPHLSSEKEPYSWQRMGLVGALAVSFFGSIFLGFHLDMSWIYRSWNYPPSFLSIRNLENPLYVGLACEGASIVDIWTTTSHMSTLAGLHPSSLLTASNEAPSWCFSGSKGQIGILLQSPSVLGAVDIYVKRGLSIFHSPWAQIATAPREIVIWGLVDGNKSRREIQRIEGLPGVTKLFKNTSHLFLPIARLEYNGQKMASNIQRAATDTLLSRSSIHFGVVVVEIRSNWGGASTCLNGINLFQLENKST